MNAADVAYLVFGGALVLGLAGIAFYLYSHKRKDQVERAKYRMLDDDE
jgi:cbb3-type cytochrome oxidase subunit 3